MVSQAHQSLSTRLDTPSLIRLMMLYLTRILNKYQRLAVKTSRERAVVLMQAHHGPFRLRALLLISVMIIFVIICVVSKPSNKVCAVYVHPHWSSLFDETSENTLEFIAQSGINTIFVDIYHPTGVGEGIFLAEKKDRWVGRSREPKFSGAFSLDQTIERAKKFSMSVHVMISCFGEMPPIDPSDEAHRAHLKEVVRYIVECFPLVDGIHLDYVRYMHELGLVANGNTDTIATFVKSIRDVVQGKALSAAVFAVGCMEEYNVARYRIGQDYKEMSQYLDFMCPMAYHLSARKELEWVGMVSRFMSSIVRKECRIYPIVQAYYRFQTVVVVSRQAFAANTSVRGPTFEVPSVGMLRFDLIWGDRGNRFSLSVRDSLSYEVSVNRSVFHFLGPSSETYVVEANVTGIWTAQVKAQAFSQDNDTVTVQISDVNEELPGYHALRSVIALVMTETDGFCIYALNNLSLEELQAVRDSVVSLGPYAYLKVVYVELGSIVCRVESNSTPFASRY